LSAYEVLGIDRKYRWIYLHADEWDDEEEDSFVRLIKTISEDLNGKIISLGMGVYIIDNVPYDLKFQWDTCFGITIVYSKDEELGAVLDFLGKYININLKEEI